MHPDQHGIQGYFEERARFERRRSRIVVLVSAAFLVALWAARIPPVARMLRSTPPILRFGYEGAEQYVRRIELKAEALAPNTGDRPAPTAVSVEARKGGSEGPRSRDRNAPPEHRPRLTDTGEAQQDLLARRLARAANVPLVRSEELVIEDLVHPIYPEDARDRGVEGRVALLALVDTTGRVADIQVMSMQVAPELRDAAVEAVWKCRFRPYRQEGQVREVYAMFRFAFRIY